MQSIVYNKDCMEVMKGYQDKYFDLAVVDPPYGIGMDKKNAHKTIRDNPKWPVSEWDNATPNKEYFIELMRVSKNQIIWGGNYFLDFLGNTQCFLVWDKGCRDFSLADAELAWTSFKSSVRIKTIHRAQLQVEGSKFHPTQKPIKLYDWIFYNYLSNGGKVIDTHLGSGSSRISADRCGNIDFVGCEIDVEYYMKQEKRFSNYKLQPELW